MIGQCYHVVAPPPPASAEDDEIGIYHPFRDKERMTE
jgi:hypothetical protein